MQVFENIIKAAFGTRCDENINEIQFENDQRSWEEGGG